LWWDPSFSEQFIAKLLLNVPAENFENRPILNEIINLGACILLKHLCCTFEAGRCAYVVLVMATFWMTEVIPMAVTALLPVVIFPWLGIMDTKDVCSNYLKVGYVRTTSLTIILSQLY